MPAAGCSERRVDATKGMGCFVKGVARAVPYSITN